MVWKHQRLILQASCSTSALITQKITAMDAYFSLRMELSSTAGATNGAASYMREAVESKLGLD